MIIGYSKIQNPLVYSPTLSRKDPTSGDKPEKSEWSPPWRRRARGEGLAAFVGDPDPETVVQTNFGVAVAFHVTEDILDDLSTDPERVLAALVKQNKVEVKIKDLTKEELKKLPHAKEKEVKSFLKYQVMEAASRAGVHPGA